MPSEHWFAPKPEKRPNPPMLTGLKAALLIAIIIALGAALMWVATIVVIEAIDFARWLRAVIREAKAAEKASIE